MPQLVHVTVVDPGVDPEIDEGGVYTVIGLHVYSMHLSTQAG